MTDPKSRRAPSGPSETVKITPSTVANAGSYAEPVSREKDEVLRYALRELDFNRALKDLPEVPPVSVLDFLSQAGQWPDDWKVGKAMQRDHGLDSVPPKTEYELGAGVWKRIRDGLLCKPTPPAPAGEVGHAFPDLRSANIARQAEWDTGGQITLAFRGNELAGEVGEACNIIKKLERERLGIAGSRATAEQLAEELADVVICTDLIAMQEGINLDAAVRRKFNATSEKVGMKTRLEESSLAARAALEGKLP